MSSTNRSNARDIHIADYYITPQKPIKQFLKTFCEDEGIDLSTQEHLVLDPCAWWDSNNDMSYPAVLFEFWADYNKIITNDIREDSWARFKWDFLSSYLSDNFPQEIVDQNWMWFDIVITNPPFNIAQDIIEESLKRCKPWWYVIMLLRLNYFWWKVRQEFWKNNMPYRCYIHNRRMSFTPDWKTDSVEYMHCVWKKWYKWYNWNTEMKIIFDF